MAYATPPTFVAGDILEAAQLNVLGEDIEFLYGVAQGVTWSGVQVYRTGSQSIANTTDTLVTWQAEAFDAGGWWTSGTNIVVPAGAIPPGYTTIAVHFICRVRFVDNGTGSRSLQVQVNGSSAGSNAAKADSGETTEVWVADYAVVAAGDVITAQVRQSSNGALNMDSAKISVVRHAPAA